MLKSTEKVSKEEGESGVGLEVEESGEGIQCLVNVDSETETESEANFYPGTPPPPHTHTHNMQRGIFGYQCSVFSFMGLLALVISNNR